ncbi:MAG: cation:proton antiporter [Flavobacteriales bacterium]|nr:cation:proton antiporter [Flavobacteriales bacterium]
MFDTWQNTLVFLGGFLIVAVAAHQLARYFKKVKLPVITGLLVVGILSGPFVFKLIPRHAIADLGYVNDFALAFIAFAAGSELYLREMRGRFVSIKWMTFGQLVVTFAIGAVAVILLAPHIAFMQGMTPKSVTAVALLFATIFVARSPASAIAIINELRAKGPFTKTVMGVTVIKDVLVIILFAVCISVAEALIQDVDIRLSFLLLLLAELLLSFFLGYLLGKWLGVIMNYVTNSSLKVVLILLSGFSAFLFAHFFKHWSENHWGVEIYLEPLLITIVASFVVTNYSRHRLEFLKIMHETGPKIYVLFFTLTGASMSLDMLLEVWGIALLLFSIRLVSLFAGGLIGGALAGDPLKLNVIAWMPYVTQAGVGLGLATVVAAEFPEWGVQFSTIVIGVIVLNQLVGPPLFKWALGIAGEDHSRAETPGFDGNRDCVIFGLENQSVALARQLAANGWKVRIATKREEYSDFEAPDLDIQRLPDINLGELRNLEMEKVEAIVTMLSDEENFRICEMAYENFGTKDMVVRLHERSNFDRFHKLGALIVEPSTAIVSLLDHFVRSPHATSLLLGMAKDQDTIELEIRNEDLHGMALRNLRLPADVIILSVTRAGQMLISHGYTRLRIGDMVTLVGSRESLEKVRMKFEGGR